MSPVVVVVVNYTNFTCKSPGRGLDDLVFGFFTPNREFILKIH